MDSVQTAQCIVYSTVVCVLLIIVGLVIFLLVVFAFGPAIDEMQLRNMQKRVNNTTTDSLYNFDYD
ncbi:uncharacterized protein LOC121529796 [Drosophila eugracilis]|uniref:uncharacterized protein LOC121529796 n=1 Tax=Drosophila eugracilis TaxID=29029 RepID=UPI001BDA1314|nr:uncharacterized protein LOC121529796 [Drosophila eugracilis]